MCLYYPIGQLGEMLLPNANTVGTSSGYAFHISLCLSAHSSEGCIFISRNQNECMSLTKGGNEQYDVQSEEVIGSKVLVEGEY